jgi:ectoine hydroxylase-related dioxygenase (phytanoyl-CoA dioxygenase family)
VSRLSAFKQTSENKIMAVLSDKQITEFLDRGYIVIPKVFDQHDLNLMIKATEGLLNSSKSLNTTTQMFKGSSFVFENQALHRVVWAGAHENDLLKLGADLRILEPVSQLLHSIEMDQLINQIHFKMPGDDIEFEWHQDSQHRGYGTADWADVNGIGSYIQTLVAIDEVTADKGPVKFVPGSHKLGHVGLNNIADVSMVCDVATAEELLMQPGDIVLFHPYVIHASTKNVSSTPRRVLINGYSYPGANHKKYPGEGSGRRLNLNILRNKKSA